MKVICINNTCGNARHLHLNEIYEASEYLGRAGQYYLINTHPFEIPIHNNIRLKEKVDLWVDKKYFLTLDEWRQSQLDKLKI
jgi:hypothetical protein